MAEGEQRVQRGGRASTVQIPMYEGMHQQAQTRLHLIPKTRQGEFTREEEQLKENSGCSMDRTASSVQVPIYEGVDKWYTDESTILKKLARNWWSAQKTDKQQLASKTQDIISSKQSQQQNRRKSLPLEERHTLRSMCRY